MLSHRKYFISRLKAIDWIAGRVENEAQFEVMREQLMFNEIMTGKLYVDWPKEFPVVVSIDRTKTQR